MAAISKRVNSHTYTEASEGDEDDDIKAKAPFDALK